MKKQQRRQRRPKPRKHTNTKGSNGGAGSGSYPRAMASAYLKSRPEASTAHAKALHAAVPRDVPLQSSHWLVAGADRAERASGLGAFEVLELIGDFMGWCHRRGHVPQQDAAVCIAQLELLGRQAGAEPKTVVLPPPRRPGEMSQEKLCALVASWEAMSFGAALAETDDDRGTYAQLMTGAMQLIGHLAEVDGVPVRLGGLDPAAFALSLDAAEAPPELGPRPEHYVSVVLEGAAMVYERCAERGYVDEATASRVGAQLQGLAMAYFQGQRAA